LAEEKDFCTLLSEQIIDERKAAELYMRLLNLFQEEEKLLLPRDPLLARISRERTIKDIEDVLMQELHHEPSLEAIRKTLCV